ncbi:MAG: hypothetical protein WA827_19035, partial [Candidatus Binatus sp.]
MSRAEQRMIGSPTVSAAPIAARRCGHGSGYMEFGRRCRRSAAMDIERSGARPSGQGPADYFTGTV